jgi:hypothetical protein
MAEKKNRERVMAEITISYVLRLANEYGCCLSPEQARVFLNEEGRAYEMWKAHDARWRRIHRVQLAATLNQP